MRGHALSVRSVRHVRQVRHVRFRRAGRAISNCFIGIGQAMQIDVIAEGVEISGQMEILAAQGCQLVQGCLTGRPLSLQAFSAAAFWQQRVGMRSPLAQRGSGA
ncbi:MAG: hypothetical protein RLZZ584_837 [Pseudomonadota bacterium]|jgi:EAL domain-containing protein (putative c-di-GMP-specific phosphodiesterase class I)